MKYIILLFVLALSVIATSALAQSYENCYGADNCQYRQVYNGEAKTYYSISADGKTMTIYGPREEGQSIAIADEAFFTTERGKITDFPGGVENLVFSGNISSIGEEAFRSAGLKSVVLPEGLTEIKTSAFFNMPHLENIVLPQSLETIGLMAFCYSSKIKSLTLPDSITSFGRDPFYTLQVESLIANTQNLEEYLKSGWFKDDVPILIDCTSGNCMAVLEAYDQVHGTSLASRVNIISRVQNDDGSTTIYKNNKIIGFKGKRIYTVEEAALVSKDKNTFKIRYK